MSNYITTIGKDKYFCLDDYFGPNEYGYVKLTEEEAKSYFPWSSFNIEGRKVLTKEELNNTKI